MATKVPNPETNDTDKAFARECEAFDVMEYVRLSNQPIGKKTKNIGYTPSWWAAMMVIAIFALFVALNLDASVIFGVLQWK